MKVRKTELSLMVVFYKFFQKKGEFVKLKKEVREINIFYSHVIFSSKKNVENRRKSCR